MLRPASPDALASLRAAASINDAALDLALMRVGILPPADLDQIRSFLRHPANQLRPSTNPVGHVEIDVVEDERPVARILNDGRVLSFAAA